MSNPRLRFSSVVYGLIALAACASFAAHASGARCAASPAKSADGTPQWRPALHYTPRRNWMNDPNGLVYENGVYHLFYQYNPHGNFWGDMSWGHATSRDLVHWDEQPVAMPANAREDIFSGSIVADARNTSDLGTPNAPPLVALYTSVYKAGSGHEPGTQAQSLAYSIDHGKTWRPYAHNPVLTLAPESRHFRDPNVTWYAPGGYWMMTAVVADAPVVKLYRSSDLIRWDFLSDFTLPDVPHRGALWEMPELLPMPLDGDAARMKWVMIVNVNPWSIAGGSGAMYFIGEFDGRTFTPDRAAPANADPAQYSWLDHGADYYAAGTFANAPGEEPVAIAWMSNWDYAERIPTTPRKGAMALPRELALKTIDGRPRVTVAPARAFDAFARTRPAVRIGSLAVASATRELGADARGTVQRIAVTIEPRSARRAGLIVRRSANGRVGHAYRLRFVGAHAERRSLGIRRNELLERVQPAAYRCATAREREAAARRDRRSRFRRSVRRRRPDRHHRSRVSVACRQPARRVRRRRRRDVRRCRGDESRRDRGRAARVPDLIGIADDCGTGKLRHRDGRRRRRMTMRAHVSVPRA